MPTTFGRYELLDRLGVGGMAEVFRARAYNTEGDSKLVVVKRILPHLSVHERFRRMFIDEAKITVQLQHVNIVQVLDLGRIDQQLFIAMELVEGRDLAAVYRRAARLKIPLKLSSGLYVVAEALRGLHHAHTKKAGDGRFLGIVHRDVSPANILISYAGEVKLSDFGIAKAVTRTEHTQTGIIKGKLKFMAPEQLRGEEIDARADVYSMGLVLYQLVGGRHPFEGLPEVDVIDRIRQGQIDPPSAFNKKLPSSIDDLVMRALAVSPADRYSSADSFRQAIEQEASTIGLVLSAEGLAQLMHVLFEQEMTGSGESASGEVAALAAPADLLIAEEHPIEGMTILHTTRHDMRVPFAKSSRTGWLVAGIVAVIASIGLSVIQTKPDGTSVPNVKIDPSSAAVMKAGSGLLEFDVAPWADVRIDGRSVGATPIRIALPAGEHKVEYTTPDGLTKQETVKVVAGKPLKVTK